MPRSECMRSANAPHERRLIPLDTESARALGWIEDGGLSAALAAPGVMILDVPDVPDNRNQTPFQFRYAHFRSGSTEAYYTNDIDHQASIVWTTTEDVHC